MKNNDVLIAIPAYNEEENIGILLDKLMKLPFMRKADILVINDGSQDKTEDICREYNVNIVNHVYNLGYGSALKTAYKFAIRNDYEYIIQVDADGQHDVCNIQNVYDALTSRNPADIVIGSRFLDQKTAMQVSFAKRVVMNFFISFIKLFAKAKITDPTSGLQGLNREAFSFYGSYNNFVIDYPDANMVIQMILNDFTIREIPAIMHDRISGESMHSGIWKPMMYTMIMFVSSVIVVLRERHNRKNRRKREKEAERARIHIQKQREKKQQELIYK